MEEKQSVTVKMALLLVDNVREMLVDGRISEEDVTSFFASIQLSANNEYYNPKDYCNYDEACKILKIGYNRNKLNKLCKEHGIVNVKIKNRPLGFKKTEIERLKEIIGK